MINLSEDQIKQLIKSFKKLSETINKIIEAIRKAFKTFFEYIRIYNKDIGYKRKAKQKMLKYFESISHGKSNNWRKIYGLHLIRNKC